MLNAKIECSICKLEKKLDINFDQFEIYNFNICPQTKCRENHYLCYDCFFQIIKLDKTSYYSENLLDVEKKIVFKCPFDRLDFELEAESHFKLLWKIIQKQKKL